MPISLCLSRTEAVSCSAASFTTCTRRMSHRYAFPPPQNDGLDQQGVRLSRSQIINKNIITRSSGINLGVASQVTTTRFAALSLLHNRSVTSVADALTPSCAFPALRPG